MNKKSSQRHDQEAPARLWHAAAAVLGLLAPARPRRTRNMFPSCKDCHFPEWECTCMSLWTPGPPAPQQPHPAGTGTKKGHHV